MKHSLKKEFETSLIFIEQKVGTIKISRLIISTWLLAHDLLIINI